MNVKSVENLSNLKEAKTKNENKIPKHVRFSLIKWLLDDEI